MTVAQAPFPHNAREGAPPGLARSWTELPVLLAFLAIIAGAVAAVLLLAPTPPRDEGPEAGFVRDMSAHHAQAVEMALIARDRTQDLELRAVATDIVLTQQAQIGQMQGWLDVWQLNATRRQPAMTWMGHPAGGSMPGMARPERIAQLKTLAPGAMDVEFLRLMIRHHQAGAAMANAVVERTDRPEVLRLARAIASSQQSEIEVLRGLLRSKGQPEGAVDPSTTGGMGMAEREQDGFFASAPAVARDTVRVGPLALAAFALVWLGLDTARRRLATRSSHVNGGAVSQVWRAVAAVGSIASALLHFGLAPAHFAESTAYGVFFVAVGLALVVVAAVVLAWPTRPAYLAGGMLSAVLLLLYVLFRLTPPPGATMSEEFDLVGLVTKATELAVAGACAVLYVRLRNNQARTLAPR